MDSRVLTAFLLAPILGAGVAVATELPYPDPVDSFDRSDVVRYFHEVYVPTEDYASQHGWTGSVSGCNAGTLSTEIHSDVIARVNYFRAMAGLSREIKLSDSLNTKCQQAALIMAYNSQLSHYPPTSWGCYTADGAQAAEASNLSSAINSPHYGPEAVTGQISDGGDGNEAVFHRRAILASKLVDEIGHGSIPLTPMVSDPSKQSCAMVLWVAGQSTHPLPDDVKTIAWPPAGFVPHQVVFERWSFGLPRDLAPSVDFSKATVSVVDDSGGPLTAEIIHRGDSSALGDPSIVWRMTDFPLTAPPTADQSYTVTVAGIADAPEASYSYQVTVIDADNLTPIELSGRASPFVGHPNTYSFEPVTGAQSYELRVATIGSGSWVEGAEASPAPKVIDGTAAAYPLLYSATSPPAASGSRSFHLVEENDVFTIERDIVPSANSTLEFDQRFRWVGYGMRAIGEIESAPGVWTEVWSRYGTTGGNYDYSKWDTAWIHVSVPLGAYDGKTIRVRFRYVWETGPGWTPGAGDQLFELGAFIDNIKVPGSIELLGEEFETLPGSSSSLEFEPDTTRQYALQLRAQLADTWFNFGPPSLVNAVVGTPPTLVMKGAGINANGQFYLDVESSGYATLTLYSSSGAGDWKVDPDFDFSQVTTGMYRFTSPLTNPTKLFRVIGEE